MRPRDWREIPELHSALENVGIDQHHIRPSNIEVSNTSLSVSPLPGGPGVWDIAVPFDAVAVMFNLRSLHSTDQGGGKAGVTGVAGRSSLDAATVSLGGHGTLASTSYNAAYSKAGGALYLSHKVFDASGNLVLALRDAYLTLTGPSTRVLRTEWTNFGSGYETLNCWGEFMVFG